MITIPCTFGGDEHTFADDWKFNDQGDPRADPRFKPTHYQYFDKEICAVYLSGAFLCEDEALDYFTVIAKEFPDVKYIAARQPDADKYSILPWIYVKDTDTVHPRE